MSSQLAHIGISVPGLSLAANSHSEWEKTATIEDMAAIVRAADRLGYSHVSCAEHIGVPADQAPRRGARYFDPLATFGYFSAVTSQIRFVTAVLVLGYHHPLEIAKRYGTLDVVSGGRVVLGLGVGTLKEEFDLLGLGGAEFVERGARADDALRALRAALGQSEPEYHGPHYDFGGLIVDPCAIQKDMPLWIGGRSVRSLRRSVTLGDGWMPFGLTVDEMATMIANARAFPSWPAGTDGRVSAPLVRCRCYQSWRPFPQHLLRPLHRTARGAGAAGGSLVWFHTGVGAHGLRSGWQEPAPYSCGRYRIRILAPPFRQGVVAASILGRKLTAFGERLPVPPT